MWSLFNTENEIELKGYGLENVFCWKHAEAM